MSAKHICIGPLNARNVFKESKPKLQQAYVHYLRSRALSLYIFCLQ